MPTGDEPLPDPWEFRTLNPYYSGEGAGVQERILDGTFDHFLFAVKCTLASRIFEFSGSDYLGELFPLLARIFAVVDKQGKSGGLRIITDTALMVQHVHSLVEAVSTAVQIPMLVNQGRKSLHFGPSGAISGPAFFSSTTTKYVDFGTFSGDSKTTQFNRYMTLEGQVYSDIVSGAIDIEAETGIAVNSGSFLRYIPQLVMSALSKGHDLSPSERKMLEVHLFVVNRATERFYTDYSPKVLSVLEEIFIFYGRFHGLADLLTEVIRNWVLREAVITANTDSDGLALSAEFLERTS